MLASFFNKSKPINFIIIALYMLLLYSVAVYKNDFSLEYTNIILVIVVGFIAYVFSMFVLNTTTQRNNLTKKSTNTIVLFAFLTTVLPYGLTNPSILLSNALLILGIQNVLNLRTGKFTKINILNASLCIGLASLAYFWSIGFISIVFLGILYFDSKNYRNWVIPLISILIIYVFATCFYLIMYDSFFSISGYIDTVSFSYENYLTRDKLFFIGVFSICIVFFVSVYLAKFNKKAKKTKPILQLVIAQLLVGIVIVLIVPVKDTSEMIFIAAPLAILGTTYLELGHNNLVKEINIWVFLMVPLLVALF
ncbi:hypothetical protein GCM10022393_06640 [Aquimarina addita]|uniref:Beta-carotene 15,15'-monooxygenase n=1 Tax=Aquimarina addita TaxID=870485 RepID=A0ABP7XC72_9FLAO